MDQNGAGLSNSYTGHQKTVEQYPKNSEGKLFRTLKCIYPKCQSRVRIKEATVRR